MSDASRLYTKFQFIFVTCSRDARKCILFVLFLLQKHNILLLLWEYRNKSSIQFRMISYSYLSKTKIGLSSSFHCYEKKIPSERVNASDEL